MSRNVLPYFVSGTVVHGFGRGSKQLGIPTANVPENVVNDLPANLPTGVYYGWASIDNGPIYEQVTSIGWNPYYKNEKKSVESHLLHKFDSDFYGSKLKLILLGYIRPERNFDSLDALIAAIHNDIYQAKDFLKLEKNQIFKDKNFFENNILVDGHGLCNSTSSPQS